MSLEQLAMDFDAPTLSVAREFRDVGMSRVADKAEREEPGFGERAFEFLKTYLREHALVNPEDVTSEAEAEGIKSPTDARAWGPVWLRASRERLIERSTVTYQRTRGHASIGVLWRSLVTA